MSQIKIIRTLKRNEKGEMINSINLQVKIEVLIVILGKPHNKVEINKIIYDWKDKNLTLCWKGFGFFELRGGEEHLDWLMELMIDRIQQYNETIKFQFYKCKNDLEWSIIKEVIGKNRLLDYITSLKLINVTSEKRTINQWRF
jgi:hypothetical protein